MALADHAGDNGLGDDEGGDQIHIDNLRKVLHAHVGHGDALDDTGVVHQDVHGAHVLFDLGDEFIHGGFVGDVGHVAVDLDALGGVGSHASVPAGLVGAVEADGGASLGQAQPHGETDGVGAAGDQGDLTGQVK